MPTCVCVCVCVCVHRIKTVTSHLLVFVIHVSWEDVVSEDTMRAPEDTMRAPEDTMRPGQAG